MTSHIHILKMENVKLKEDNEKSDINFGQKKTDDDTSTSLLKVYIAIFGFYNLKTRCCITTN